MRVVETLLIFTVTALNLSIVAESIGADELVANAQQPSCCLKEGFQGALAGRKAIDKLKTVVGLNTPDGNAFAGKMRNDFV